MKRAITNNKELMNWCHREAVSQMIKDSGASAEEINIAINSTIDSSTKSRYVEYMAISLAMFWEAV